MVLLVQQLSSLSPNTFVIVISARLRWKEQLMCKWSNQTDGWLFPIFNAVSLHIVSTGSGCWSTFSGSTGIYPILFRSHSTVRHYSSSARTESNLFYSLKILSHSEIGMLILDDLRLNSSSRAEKSANLVLLITVVLYVSSTFVLSQQLQTNTDDDENLYILIDEISVYTCRGGMHFLAINSSLRRIPRYHTFHFWSKRLTHNWRWIIIIN